jgi:hypothetical protein
MGVRAAVPRWRERSPRADGKGVGLPAAKVDRSVRVAARSARAGERCDYWLERCEGFQVSAPGRRIGSVALVLTCDDGLHGFVIRTGWLRTRTVFVPIDQVASVAPRHQRIELVAQPERPRAGVTALVPSLREGLVGREAEREARGARQDGRTTRTALRRIAGASRRLRHGNAPQHR